MNFYRCLPALALAAVIFYLSHQPGDQIGIDLFPHADKIVHAAVYALLALSCHYAVGRPAPESQARVYAWILVIVIGYGISDEFHQAFIPYRDASIADLMADATGALLASSGIWRWRRRLGRRLLLGSN